MYPNGIHRLQELQHELPGDTSIRVSTPAGTEITCISREWQIDEWFEIHTSPVEGTSDGTIVANLACHLGRLTVPVRLTVSAGRLVDIMAEDPADLMSRRYLEDVQRHIDKEKANACVAEIGIGANAGAVPSETIMESESVDKTVHFCFGDNSRYNGNNTSDWHGGTVVCGAPTIESIMSGGISTIPTTS